MLLKPVTLAFHWYKKYVILMLRVICSLVMTTRTSWYPLSFRNDMKGNLISLSCDSYGYQNIAEYEELCHSLNDGVVLVEQQMEVGDQFHVCNSLMS